MTRLLRLLQLFCARDGGTRLGRVVDFGQSGGRGGVCRLRQGRGSGEDRGRDRTRRSREPRHARGVLDFFHPVADRNRYRLPPTARSIARHVSEHEKHKEVVRRTQYKSLYSDKTFYNEFYVDKHMDNRHMDKVPPGADVCLADYCEVLRAMASGGNIRSFVRPGSSASRSRCSQERMRLEALLRGA